MDEFEFLRRMFQRLEEVQQIYRDQRPAKFNAAEAAIACSIRDYLDLRSTPTQEPTDHE